MTATEVMLSDFERWVEDPETGDVYPEYDFPDALEYDNARCQADDCETLIGGSLETDRYTDAERSVWHSTWRLPDGRYVCEDCANEE